MDKNEEKRNQRVKNVQMGLWVILILLQMAVVNCLEVRAESAASEREFPESAGNAAPAMNHEKTMIRQVQKDVIYEKVEGGASLPETLDIRVEEDGVTVTAVCSIQERTVLREWWEEGFSFPVTFHSYDAAYYSLRDILIPYNEERPELEGYEKRLLELIGVPLEEYRISSVQWDGEAYQGEDGELCRDAVGTGEKLLRDYRVRYAGMAKLPVRPKAQVQTEAETVSAESAAETEEAVEESRTEVSISAESSEEEQTQAEDEAPLTLWQKITRTLLIAIGIGALLFFGGLLILAFLWVVKKLRKWYTGRKS